MRILGKIWWIPLVIYMIIAPAFMSDRIDNVPCRKIEINIKDSLKYSFVTRDKLFSMVQNDQNKVLGDETGKIGIADIEKNISGVKELERAEVYHTIDGILHIDADQRDPAVRIITRYGKSYYIDSHGVIIPHSRTFTPRVLVVSGYLEIPGECLARGNVNSLGDDNILKNIIDLVEYVNGDEFWSGQIEQIWVNPSGELEMVPRVGNHIIKFGDTGDYLLKFNHLKALYIKALPEVGWDSYREINLRYDGQIICKKR